MAPRSRGMERILSAAVSSPRSSSQQMICRSCRRAAAAAAVVVPRRGYAVAAAAAVETPSPQDALAATTTTTTTTTTAAEAASTPTCIVKAGVLLSRPPLITPEPHPFEAAYHLYQRRLNERLVLPFTQYLYYKRGTPSFEAWRQRRAARGGVAGRDVGAYNAYAGDSWHDEVLVGDRSGSDEHILEQLVDEEGRGAEFTPRGGNVKTSGLTRLTAADARNDTRSLERRLERTLYLLVKTGTAAADAGPVWAFPSGPLLPRQPGQNEGLREAAKRVLAETCGRNMNTWFVGAHPVGHWIQQQQQQQRRPLPDRTGAHEAEALPEKTFFMKARIFAGQANVQQTPASGAQPYADFQWLTKEEIERLVDRAYWSRIQDMLVAQ